MARKKKSDANLKATEGEASVAAVEPKAPTRLRPEPAPAKAPAVEVAESKASEVIPPVTIALLEAHPQLPDGDAILASFAEHYRDALERAAQAALAPPEPPPEPVREAKPTRTGAQGRPVLQRSAWTPPVPPPLAEPEAAVIVVEDEITTAPPMPPDLGALTAPEAPADADALFAEPPASVFADDVELFGDSPKVPDDDIFAALGKTDKREDDHGFTPSSDYSDPFIQTSPPSGGSDLFAASETFVATEPEPEPEPVYAEPDERTMAIPVFEDVEAAPVEEAAPTDRTTMIQAMPDDEPVEGAEAPEGDDNGAKAGRKSRKSKKKR